MLSRGGAYAFGAVVVVALFSACSAKAPRERAQVVSGGGTAAGGSGGGGHSAHGE